MSERVLVSLHLYISGCLWKMNFLDPFCGFCFDDWRVFTCIVILLLLE
jgi:hypothetical protein